MNGPSVVINSQLANRGSQKTNILRNDIVVGVYHLPGGHTILNHYMDIGDRFIGESDEVRPWGKVAENYPGRRIWRRLGSWDSSCTILRF